MTRHVWVIGCPRSGTTYAAEVLGSAAGAVCLNEPWDHYPHHRADLWGPFPEAAAVVLKYCENYAIAHHLAERCPDSWFVHVLRDPDQVVHSMAQPRADSVPYRDFPELGKDPEGRVLWAMNRWYCCVGGCLGVGQAFPWCYLEVRYEQMALDLTRAAEKLGLRLPPEADWPAPFANRNLPPSELTYLRPWWYRAAADLRARFLWEMP